MKKRTRCLASTILFFVIYTVAGYLLTGNINWKMAIAATIIYAAIYTAVKLVCPSWTNKFLK